MLELREKLKDFGYDSFRPGQYEVMEKVMRQRNTLAVFPTGGGKSLCYQLPCGIRESITIVVSPLIALMLDQVEILLRKGNSVNLCRTYLSECKLDFVRHIRGNDKQQSR